MLLSCCWSVVCLYICHISYLLGQSCMKWEQIAKCERLSNTLGGTLILVGPGVENPISDLTFALLNEIQAFQIWKYQNFWRNWIDLLVNVILPIAKVWFMSIFWMNIIDSCLDKTTRQVAFHCQRFINTSLNINLLID